jgi:hypothetical protein
MIGNEILKHINGSEYNALTVEEKLRLWGAIARGDLDSTMSIFGIASLTYASLIVTKLGGYCVSNNNT